MFYYFMSFNENIDYLQDVFYTKSLPTLDKVIELPVDNMPYMVRTADHDSYSFHLSGQELAALYEEHGEKILQQNIRMFEGGNPTNEAINRSCTGDDSANFYHYNNGVSILCESAKWDAFKKCIELKKPQIVNGGQTVRVLSQAKLDGELKDNVLVPVRIITSQGNKEFAGNVAVNLNNQTRVQGQFLKSNNPKIVQLAASLKALDWYLERREGEIEELTKEEREKIEASINGPLSEKTIPLKEGTQAYAATFYGNPGLARLNPAKMFIDVSDGGQFNRIFSESLSADNFAKAYMLYRAVDQKVSEFKRIKRRKAYDSDWKEHYEKILGKEFVDSRLSVLDDIVPQSTLFVIGICYQWYILKQGYTFEQLIEEIETLPEAINFALDQIVETQEASGDKWNKSWQSLLKNQKFFEDIIQNLGL